MPVRMPLFSRQRNRFLKVRFPSEKMHAHPRSSYFLNPMLKRRDLRRITVLQRRPRSRHRRLSSFKSAHITECPGRREMTALLDLTTPAPVLSLVDRISDFQSLNITSKIAVPLPSRRSEMCLAGTRVSVQFRSVIPHLFTGGLAIGQRLTFRSRKRILEINGYSELFRTALERTFQERCQ